MEPWDLFYSKSFCTVVNQSLREYQQHCKILDPREQTDAAALVGLLEELYAFAGKPASLPDAFDPRNEDYPGFRVAEHGRWHAYLCLNAFQRRMHAVLLMYGERPTRAELLRELAPFQETCSDGR